MAWSQKLQYTSTLSRPVFMRYGPLVKTDRPHAKRLNTDGCRISQHVHSRRDRRSIIAIIHTKRRERVGRDVYQWRNRCQMECIHAVCEQAHSCDKWKELNHDGLGNVVSSY
eukprot:scaffold1657_cov182-Alexandrium_tamarense.AAC.2